MQNYGDTGSQYEGAGRISLDVCFVNEQILAKQLVFFTFQ